ncbi:hypothetical protein BD626DRAFT_573657 [Schizophyllum amplum]|uniref:Uncharacterized protein n=1 Tax=Schizophyllum amplum TaxID=97359 RepID=A0A550C0X2_9AGAR|nr:hypothetical protein BD626DRAFT_573657 [Auriculariopsis ampla]
MPLTPVLEMHTHIGCHRTGSSTQLARACTYQLACAPAPAGPCCHTSGRLTARSLSSACSRSWARAHTQPAPKAPTSAHAPAPPIHLPLRSLQPARPHSAAAALVTIATSSTNGDEGTGVEHTVGEGLVDRVGGQLCRVHGGGGRAAEPPSRAPTRAWMCAGRAWSGEGTGLRAG